MPRLYQMGLCSGNPEQGRGHFEVNLSDSTLTDKSICAQDVKGSLLPDETSKVTSKKIRWWYRTSMATRSSGCKRQKRQARRREILTGMEDENSDRLSFVSMPNFKNAFRSNQRWELCTSLSLLIWRSFFFLFVEFRGNMLVIEVIGFIVFSA